jgi:hypothetical protein
MVRAGLVLTALLITTSLYAKDVHYPELSHRNTKEGDLSGITLSGTDSLRVTIRDTNTECFTYNGTGVSAETREANQTDVYSFLLRNDESYRGFEIVVAPKVPLPAGCTGVGEPGGLSRTRWVIPILSPWRIAMAGAVTFDKLTDPKYFLEPGKQTSGGQSIDGYFIRRNGDEEDVVRTSAGAVAHIYYASFPIEFAFGVSLAENPTYLVGAGLRLGNQAHVIAGAAIGPRAILPSHLTEGSFVTDANAISTLGSRTDVELFVGISLAFFEKNIGKLTGLIKPATP